MYCTNCGAELTVQTNFCPYCGARVANPTTSISLYNKAAQTAQSTNVYNLVLVSTGSCNIVTAGDILEDIFGYTDAESTNLIRMIPVVVGENLTADEAVTVAQMLTEYGMDVSITDRDDKYVDLTDNAVSSVFDASGNLLAKAAAIIGALTVANRITSYRRYKKPSLLERLFRVKYKPKPVTYKRNFRPVLSPSPLAPRRTIRKPVGPRSAAPHVSGVPKNDPGRRTGFAGSPSHTGKTPATAHAAKPNNNKPATNKPSGSSHGSKPSGSGHGPKRG